MHLRDASPEDSEDIAKVLRAAFATHPYSDHTEHLIVARLRTANALTVSLVAVEEGSVLGYVACSPVRIDGRASKWFGLGPLAVLPAAQGRGIGGVLTCASITRLRDANADGIVLLGEPEYYHRFGFESSRELVLPDVSASHFMSLSLRAAKAVGVVSYHPAFGPAFD